MLKQDHVAGKMDDEISIFDIFSFLTDNWQTILGVGIAGILASVTYLNVTPPQYEADALVEMAQIRNRDSNNNAASFTNVEAPALLVERLKTPSTYTPKAIKTCGLKDEAPSQEVMAKIVKTTLLRELPSVVSISVRRTDPEVAKQCVGAIFEMIHDQQANLAKLYQDELKATIGELQSRLRKIQDFASKAEKTGLQQTVYLAQRDESIYLMSQIDELKRILSLEKESRLVSPIYASQNKVSPRNALILALGTILGLALGLFFAVGKKLLKSWRARNQIAKDA